MRSDGAAVSGAKQKSDASSAGCTRANVKETPTYLYIRRTNKESGSLLKKDQSDTSSALDNCTTCSRALQNSKSRTQPMRPYSIDSRQQVIVFCARRKNLLFGDFRIVQRIRADNGHDLAFGSGRIFFSIKPPHADPASSCATSG